MDERPDWSEWILKKNAEFKDEELRKSEYVTLEKIWSAAMLGTQGTHAARKRMQDAEHKGNVQEFKIPESHLPKDGESKEAHHGRVVSALKQKFPKVPHEKHAAAADRAWKHHNSNE